MRAYQVILGSVACVAVLAPPAAAGAQVMMTSPASLDSGTVPVPSGTSQRLVTVFNATSATEDLHFTVSVTSGASDFSVFPTGGILPPGASTNVVVTFDPSATGTRTGVVEVDGDDVLNPADTIALTGVGSDKEIAVAPTSYGFGTVLIPGATAARVFTVDNPGTAQSLRVSRVQITGADATRFELTDNDCSGQDCQPAVPFQIAAGGSMSWSVRCHPLALPSGDYSATVTWTSDADTAGRNTATVACTGQAPDVAASSTELDFEDVVLGQVSAPQTFTLSNTASGSGAATLRYSFVPAGGFSVSPWCNPCSLAPGGSASFAVTFDPYVHQDYDATFLVTSDDPDEGSLSIALRGHGLAPVLSSDPDQAIDFGEVPVGTTSAPITIMVTNSGDAPTQVRAGASGIYAFWFANGGDDYGDHDLPIGGHVSWTVTCTPDVLGRHNAAYQFVTNTAWVPTLQLGMNCTGVDLGFVPSSGLAFGDVAIGSSSTRRLTIHNGGAETATIADVSVSTPFSLAVVGGGPPLDLAAGEDVAIDVTFTPTDESSSDSELSATFTSGSGFTLTAPLHGQGVVVGAPDAGIEGLPDAGIDAQPGPVDGGSPDADSASGRADGCGCRTGSSADVVPLALLAIVGLRRRRT